jgi:hypothetical protein
MILFDCDRNKNKYDFVGKKTIKAHDNLALVPVLLIEQDTWSRLSTIVLL